MQTLPKSIQTIIYELEKQNQNLDNKALTQIIKKVEISKDEFLKYAKFDHCKTESYGRNIIYQSQNFGIYVMSWSPGDFTGVHGHGHSEWGVVCFLGDADHRTYKANGKKIKLETSEIISEGTVAPVCGDLVHAMGNLSKQPFITLHIYGSNSYSGTITEDSTLYEIEKNRIRKTFGPAFINISDDLCKENIHGIETDEKTKEDHSKIIQDFYKRNNIKM